MKSFINKTIYFTNQTVTKDNICIKKFNKKNMKIMYLPSINNLTDNNSSKIRNNIKISIKKNINVSSPNGRFILYNLGYNTDDYEKIILKCRYSLKSYIFNKKINNVLLIIVNYNGSLIIYKYNIYKNKYTYDSTYIQEELLEESII